MCALVLCVLAACQRVLAPSCSTQHPHSPEHGNFGTSMPAHPSQAAQRQLARGTKMTSRSSTHLDGGQLGVKACQVQWCVAFLVPAKNTGHLQPVSLQLGLPDWSTAPWTPAGVDSAVDRRMWSHLPLLRVHALLWRDLHSSRQPTAPPRSSNLYACPTYFALMCAPLSSSFLIASSRPFDAARCRGVHPALLCASTGDLYCISTSMIFTQGSKGGGPRVRGGATSYVMWVQKCKRKREREKCACV